MSSAAVRNCNFKAKQILIELLFRCPCLKMIQLRLEKRKKSRERKKTWRKPLIPVYVNAQAFTNVCNNFRHPYVTFFHIAFRCAAIVVYILCGWFSDSFITSFVTVILLLSMDFWTVKNITGRLMVGLRWWNYVDDEGKSHWVYEARKVHFIGWIGLAENFNVIPLQGSVQNRINDREANIFWTALVMCPVVWSVLFLIALIGFKLKWLVRWH